MSNEYINEIYNECFPDDAPLPSDLMKLCLSFLTESHVYNYKSGEKSEHNLLNGEKHGIQKSWYANGQLKHEENYKAGRKHGVCKIYYEKGQLRLERHYVNNKLHGVQRYW